MRFCVFCGSAPGRTPNYLALADAVGAGLAAAGIGVVFGGGNIGMMGRVADAALAAGGEVIGVIPRALAEREVAHGGLTALHLVDSMHERKALMNALSDGFIMLPGGFGTFEEFCEVTTWVQLRIIDKPCILVNGDGYFDPLIAMFDRGVDEGFISVESRAIVSVVATADELLERLAAEPHPT